MSDPESGPSLKESKSFQDSIELEKPMSRDEAVRILATFHGVEESAILRAFSNLKNASEGAVFTFGNSVAVRVPCIILRAKKQDGSFESTSLIDRFTGQPIQHTS